MSEHDNTSYSTFTQRIRKLLETVSRLWDTLQNNWPEKGEAVGRTGAKMSTVLGVIGGGIMDNVYFLLCTFLNF